MSRPGVTRPAILIAGALFVASCAQAPATSEEARPSTTTTPSAGASASAEPSPDVTASATPAAPPIDEVGFTWTEHAADGDVVAIIADGDRFVAVGRAQDMQGAWVSADGSSWDQMAVPPPALDPPPGFPGDAAKASAMGTLVRLDETLYSFGFFNFMDHIQPVGWRWSDGGQWEPIASTSGFFASGRVTDAVAGDGMLVVARHEAALTLDGIDSSIWAWSPATSWVQSNWPTGYGPLLFTDLAKDDGQYLAVGFAVNPAPLARQVPVVVGSADGLGWTALQPPIDEGQLCAIQAEPGGGFLAIGVEKDRTVAWTSPNGSEWSGVTLAGEDDMIDDPAPEPFVALCELVTLAGDPVAVVADAEGLHSWIRSATHQWIEGPEMPDVAMSDPLQQQVAAMNDTIVIITHGLTADNEVTSTLHVGTLTR